ncbi:MAG: hypothetical protein FJ086_14755 [Deltaproteobacteria bacterium]|nr:hypothetical protein [Deltaproteobacteria bacterium]
MFLHRASFAVLTILAGCGLPPPGDTPCDGGGCSSAVVDAGVSCRGDGDCSGKAPHCEAGAGTCVECTADAHCASRRCVDHACAPIPDSCALALPLSPTMEGIRVEGTTRDAVDDVLPACALGRGAPDVVYRLEVPSAGRLSARVVPASPTLFQPVLVLASSCGAQQAAEAPGCAYAEDAQAEPVISRDVPAGAYYLWVDGDSGTSGEFVLEVRLEPSIPGDACGQPLPLPLTGPVSAVEGTTVGMNADEVGSCGGSDAEVVYALQVDAPSGLELRLSPLDEGFIPVLYLRRAGACGSNAGADQLGCDVGLEGAAGLFVPRLEPGTYFLFVDGASAAPAPRGRFRLEITRLPPLEAPSNDGCGSPAVLAPPPGGTGRVVVTGDTRTALNDANSGPCGGAAPDVAYRIPLAEARSVTARAVPVAGAAYKPVVYFRAEGACASGDVSALLACAGAGAPGAPAETSLDRAGPGEVTLWVDGTGTGAGAFTLEVDFGAPVAAPANDTCATAQALAPGTPVSGTTAGAGDDTATCAYPAHAVSADVVYELEVPTASSLRVDVAATASSALQPVVSLRAPGACTSEAGVDTLFCTWPDVDEPGRTTRFFPSVPPGRYALWVEGDLLSRGDFQLDARLGAEVPAPANDDCSGAALLLPNTPTAGDTRGAHPDTLGWDVQSVGGTGLYAPDVVYRFDNPSPQARTLTVTPDPADGDLLRPVIYVRGPGPSRCASENVGIQVGIATAPARGAPAQLTLPQLPAGTYYLWVDGRAHQGGRFTVLLQ